jgi:Protein of unknown function (DUF2934)
MHPEERFNLVKKRAYEVYLGRDPNFGTAEEDWWEAEREIEKEEQLASPERKEPTRWSDLRKAKEVVSPT